MSRRIKGTCFIDHFGLDEPVETTAEQDAQVKELLTSMCDPKQAAKRLELLNPPLDWSESKRTVLAGSFSLLPKDELQPIKTVEYLQRYIDMLKVRR
ncbi:hypothetical protein A1F94_007568 [Pyrenophora tritici-repentis]|nr:hypothetical protein A1F94_007568 [Pyrenophora tritici-repentis]PWO23835.1 rRNA-processing protein FCF2 [Pyrenophora tritici-repentis]